MGLLSTVLAFLMKAGLWILGVFTIPLVMKLVILAACFWVGFEIYAWKFGLCFFFLTYLAPDPATAPGAPSPGTTHQAFAFEFRLNWGEPLFQLALFYKGKTLFNFWHSNWWTKAPTAPPPSSPQA
jgi:hypothetical protein